MTMQLSLFQEAAVPQAAKAPRGSACSRNPDAGPGSCWHWWEMCPAKVRDCYSRATVALAARHGIAERDKITPPFQDALARLAARRRGEDVVEPACCHCEKTDLTPGDWKWVNFEPRLCSSCAGVSVE